MSEGGRSPPTAMEVLAKVPKPGGLTRALSRACVLYRVVSRAAAGRGPLDYRTSPSASAAQGSLASSDVLQGTSGLGLRFLGVYAYLGLIGWVPREAWATEDGEVRLSARRDKARGAVESKMASYYLSTTFDDGTVLVTYSTRASPISSGERTDCRGGTGELAADLASHRAEVARRVASSPDVKPIFVSTLDDHLALAAYHDRFATTDVEIANIVNLRLYSVGGLAIVLALLASVLMRLLGR